MVPDLARTQSGCDHKISSSKRIFAVLSSHARLAPNAPLASEQLSNPVGQVVAVLERHLDDLSLAATIAEMGAAHDGQ